MSTEDIRNLLLAVPDSYEDFVDGMLSGIKDNPVEAERLASFIQEHPTAYTDRIIGYMDGFPDEYFDSKEVETTFSVA